MTTHHTIPTTVRALTVRQPWAWAIAHAGKDVENRWWATRWRGQLLIHAGKTQPTHWEQQVLLSHTGVLPATYALGAIVAVAQLTGICPPHRCQCFSPWAEPGRYHWQLRSIRPLAQPIPCSGARGLWRPNPATQQAVHAALQAT